MHYLVKYTAVSALFLAASGGLSALGLLLADEIFARDSASHNSTIITAARTTAPSASNPASVLLGTKPKSLAELRARQKRNGEWVEVVDAVNMRRGPSSSQRVIEVQLAGTELRVASRDGKWVEVIEPDSGRSGWVFEKYVKQIEPASRRADAADSEETTVR